MKTHTSTNPYKKAGEYISNLLQAYDDVPVLLLLSGGSAMNVLDFITLQHMSERVTLCLADERINAPDEDSNAWKLVQTNWFQEAKKHGVTLCALEEGALKEWKNGHENGKIITLLGMGGDGHTAGILPMPNDENHFNTLFINTDK